MSDERVREIAEEGEVYIEPLAESDFGRGVGHENWPSKEARSLAREVQELRQERGPVPDDDPVLPLGARLAELLDADHWNNVEPMLDSIRATLAATEARLGEAEKRADAAVAIAREWDDDFQRFVSGGCDVAAVKDRRAKLATLTGGGG